MTETLGALNASEKQSNFALHVPEFLSIYFLISGYPNKNHPLFTTKKKVFYMHFLRKIRVRTLTCS